MHGKGLGLHEVAVGAGTLEELIRAEATGQLEWIYSSLGLPFAGTVSEQEADVANEYFLIAVLDFGNEVANGRLELDQMKARVIETYPDWQGMRLWLEDLRRSYGLEQFSRRNPFVQRMSGFDVSVEFALKLGAASVRGARRLLAGPAHELGIADVSHADLLGGHRGGAPHAVPPDRLLSDAREAGRREGVEGHLGDQHHPDDAGRGLPVEGLLAAHLQHGLWL